MEFIILLLTSGIPGLYTYISLDRRSILGNVTEDIRKVYLSAFSLISALIFFIVFTVVKGEDNLSDLLNNITVTQLVISFMISLGIIIIFNLFLFPKTIKLYRTLSNDIRNSEGKNSLIDQHLSGFVFDDNKFLTYIEIYNSDKLKISSGEVIYSEIDKEGSLQFLLKPASLKVKEPYIKNHLIDRKYNYYSTKDNQLIKVYKLRRCQSSSSS